MAIVLIADDDPMILRLLEVSLTAAGHSVVLAEDGREALDLVTQEDPDILLLDGMMPELTGLEVLEALKNDDTTKDMPVVLMTALTEREEIDKGLDLGATEYVVKPFAPKDMITIVNRLTKEILV
jgi:two-component system, cell cycle response regulator